MTLRSLALALLVPTLTLAAAPAGAKPPARTAPAPATSPSAGGSGALAVGGFLGYETADFSGLSLRLDGELPLRPLSPKVSLSLVGSLGYSRLTWDPGFGVEATANVVKLVPAARFTLPLAPKLSVFGDAGLGLAYVSASVDFPPATNAAGFADVDDSTLNLMLRLGVGAFYAVDERLRLGVLLEVDPIFGDFGFKSSGIVTAGSQSTFLVQAGLMYRL